MYIFVFLNISNLVQACIQRHILHKTKKDRGKIPRSFFAAVLTDAAFHFELDQRTFSKLFKRYDDKAFYGFGELYLIKVYQYLLYFIGTKSARSAYRADFFLH